MSVEQRIKISCDNFDCTATIHNGLSLLNARAIAGTAGWVNTLHFIGMSRKSVLQDFCPEHRDQGFDFKTWNEQERTDAGNGD